MRVIRAWCDIVMSDAPGLVSHGICPNCSLTVEQAWHRSLVNQESGVLRAVRRPFLAPTQPLPGFPLPGRA